MFPELKVACLISEFTTLYQTTIKKCAAKEHPKAGSQFQGNSLTRNKRVLPLYLSWVLHHHHHRYYYCFFKNLHLSNRKYFKGLSLLIHCLENTGHRFNKIKDQETSCVCVPAQQPHGLQPTRLLCPRDSPGKSTWPGCRFLLQEIFPTPGSNP